MRRAVLAIVALAALAGCGASPQEQRAEALAGPVDDAARDVLALLGEEVSLAPEEELDALADTQREPCPGTDRARHRTDATLELDAAPPTGLAERVRGLVPDDLALDWSWDGTTLEVGVVGTCTDIGAVRSVELSLEPRYRVRPWDPHRSPRVGR